MNPISSPRIRHDKVGVRLRQIKKFLFSLAQTHAEQAAVAQTDERLKRLVADIVLVAGKIEEAFQPSEAIGRDEHQDHRRRNRRQGDGTEMQTLAPETNRIASAIPPMMAAVEKFGSTSTRPQTTPINEATLPLFSAGALRRRPPRIYGQERG